MGIAYTCDTYRKVTYVVWDGVISVNDWRQAIEKYLVDPDYLTCTTRIIDQTSIRQVFPFDGSRLKLALELVKTRPARAEFDKIAIIADRSFGLAQTVARLLGIIGDNVIVFNHIKTACTYLSLDFDSTEKVLVNLRAELREHDPQPFGLKIPFA